MADVMEAMCSHRPYRASLGLAETMDELSRNKGILYDAEVVETCLKLYWQDQPASLQVSAAKTPLPVVMPRFPVYPDDGAWDHETLVRGRSLPQVAVSKWRQWARLLPQRHRAWMQVTSASLMVWLIMTSLKGF